MVSRPLWILWPAFMDRLNKSIASGRISSNFFIRLIALAADVSDRDRSESQREHDPQKPKREPDQAEKEVRTHRDQGAERDHIRRPGISELA